MTQEFNEISVLSALVRGLLILIGCSALLMACNNREVSEGESKNTLWRIHSSNYQRYNEAYIGKNNFYLSLYGQAPLIMIYSDSFYYRKIRDSIWKADNYEAQNLFQSYLANLGHPIIIDSVIALGSMLYDSAGTDSYNSYENYCNDAFYRETVWYLPKTNLNK